MFCVAITSALSLSRCVPPSSRAPVLHRRSAGSAVFMQAGAAAGGKRAARRRRGQPQPASHAPAASAQPPPTGLASGPAGEFAGSLRACVRNKQPHKARELYDAADGAVLPVGESYAAVMRALLKLSRVDLALQLHRDHTHAHPLLADGNTTAVLFSRLLRRGTSAAADGVAEATALLADIDARSPPPRDTCSAPPSPASQTARLADALAGQAPLWVAASRSMLPALALEQLRRGDAPAAEAVALRFARTARAAAAAAPPLETLKALTRAFGKARCVGGVYACLEAAESGGIAPDAELLQVLVDALVHAVRFVKGGVSMETLPTGGLAEVAFVGRSNVGKSSLVNMVLGRRAIAYTSKTPGKTQQYNYFAVNEGRAVGSFHLVDMPGLGFAKVAAPLRARWNAFLSEYFASRRELRMVVHLIDSQVPLQETDVSIMQMVGAAVAARSEQEGSGLAPPLDYAVVLTKADKNDGRVSSRTVDQVRRALESAGCPAATPLVPSSAKTRMGREAVWMLLREVMSEVRLEES